MHTDTANAALATQLCQPETLHAAWRKVRANKGGPRQRRYHDPTV